jgi:DNA repair exonuclease SbcCD ATPase subunit
LFKLILIYIFILADVKHEENKEKDEEIKRIIEEIKRKDEEIKRIIKEKDEEIKRKDEEIKRKDEEINENNSKLKKEIYRVSKTAWDDYVGEDFEIENGVLGLERDVYLSMVKFLNSHTLRKV